LEEPAVALFWSEVCAEARCVKVKSRTQEVKEWSEVNVFPRMEMKDGF
jgi:hypothetical protein